jgi:ribonuclease HI
VSIIKRCPSSFPVPNHLSTTLCDTDEYDFDWTQKHRPPSRLGKALRAVSPWVHPDADVEDTAQPITAPWSAPTITVDIQNLPKDAAATAHLSFRHDLRGDPHNIIAYTDGSQLSTQTGAGFYIPHGLPNPVRTVIALGSTSEVFDVELKAIAECLRTYLKYIKRHRLHDRSIHLFTDNQSAILCATRLDRGPGQETALDILHTTNTLLQRSAPVTLHWVPGHTDIEGNEEADRLAKLATSCPPRASTPITLSWLRRQIKEQHSADWADWYNTSPKPKTYDAPHRRRLDSAYTSLPRRQSTAILGLRTGHGYFLDYLANPPTDQYPSRTCTCPLHPP